ncbi:hypothetical protein SAMN05216553_103323 [Lentzea fradiae]|uniref:Uncharacterized protein n=1 Tax=Lentzea fradiae TaxID=200378 RepID=A0A1G7P1N0_9PSEU|nr:hypothetical protein SAMN05216553_103323 [Lentzea fradiae]
MRLRPVVRATRTADGLHLRGWASSCTITGGSGLWELWRRLEPRLSEGVAPESLGVPEGTAPAVRAAVETILDQLRDHDMLVSMPEPWGAGGPAPDVAAWLESVAADPVDAWRRLRAGVVTMTGNGLLADAAVRSAEAVGLRVHRAAGPSDELLLSTGTLVVQAGSGAEAGYVLPAREGFTSFNTEVINRIAARLGLTGDPGEVLAALVGAAAVHRLTCAVTGLADAPEQDHGFPVVLVARTGPLRSAYHPLLTGPPRPFSLDALTDRELGPVETPELGPLPQVPVNLALSGDALGIGTTADEARLRAALNAIKCDGVLGVDDLHARGAALRLAARYVPGEPAEPGEWTTGRTARRWWKALTLRFGRPAVVDVRKLAEDAYRAEVRQGQRVLAWAVEVTAADAVAFAALAAAAHAQAGRDGTAHVQGFGPDEDKLQRALELLPGVRVSPLSLDPELTAAGLVAYTVDER